jgi:ferric-dicitrate binding protein FerR (iron transport regulator)
MNNEESLKVLETALNAATLKGVYSLSDTHQIVTALKTIQTAVSIANNSTATVLDEV